MRIDLRYVIVVVAFYAPGLLMLCGAWMLGYSTAEVREVVAMFGGSVGLLSGWLAVVIAIHGAPIWWRIGGGGK